MRSEGRVIATIKSYNFSFRFEDDTVVNPWESICCYLIPREPLDTTACENPSMLYRLESFSPASDELSLTSH
ncbi:hypothetical protein Bca101_009671 [Brassica carinata]